jgi:hypothetical protein
MRFCISPFCQLPLSRDHDSPHCCSFCAFIDVYGEHAVPDTPWHTEACISAQHTIYRLGNLVGTIFL